MFSVFRRWLPAALFVLFASSLPLAAQNMFGRISGTVLDPSGAPIAGARVTITNTDTQAVRSVTTDDHGFYVAENLPIGPYTVAATQTGFKASQQTNNSVTADARLTVNLKLQIGDATQTVEVTATAEDTLNTVSAEISQTIDKTQIDNVPLNGRSYMELLTLVPGAVISNPDQFSVLTSLSATNQSVNGHRTNSNNMTVDGMINLDGGANGSLLNNISPDFMQEVKIQTSNFSSQYGRSSGVAFNLVTKTGTNKFHGGAFEYFRNDALDARNFFSPSKTQLRFNDFGYDVGGPIRKNKLFFFVGEEWKRLRQQAAPIRTSLPTTAELQGNFAGTGHTINEPGTKTPFPGNAIPASLITPDGKAITNVYNRVTGLAAAFNNSAVANNAIFQTPNPLNYREDLVRLDYRINEKHTLYGRFVDDYNNIYLAYGSGSASSSYIPVSPEYRNRPANGVVLSETWLVSPSVVNEAHVGGSWNGQRYQDIGNYGDRSTYGFTFQRVFNSVGAFPNGIPDMNIQNFEQWKGPDQTLVSPITNIEFNDAISIVRGQHSIKLGAAVIRYRKDQNGRSYYDGQAIFNTGGGNPYSTGYALADALMGNFQTYNEAAYDPMGHYRYTEPAAFIDDNWQVSRKLSVNLGMRWEYMMSLYSAANNLAEFVPSLYNPAQAVKLDSSGNVVPGSGNIYNGLQRVGNGINPDLAYLVPNAASPAVLGVPAGAPRGMYPSQNAWEPRIGLAYALNDKTVIRAGAGLYYDRMQGNPTMYTLNNPPYVGSSQYLYSNLNNITGGATVSAPWGTIQTIDPNLKTPYSEQISFGIQRELPKKLFTEVDYVGTFGRHLLVEPDINQPSFDVLAAAPTSAKINTLRPFAGYSTIQQFISEGTSNYHALQASVSRRAGSLYFTAAYTFSKNLSDASSDTANNYDYFNIHAMYGPAYSGNSGSSIDVRHAFVGTLVWTLPALRGYNRALRAPLGGWQLSSIIHLQSGFYYTVTGTSPGPLTVGRMADYLGGPGVLPNPGPNGWFNPAAFAAAPQGRWGTTGSGNVEGPGMQIYNLSLTRFFNIRKDGSVNLRFRADFMNAFNCVNFTSPITSITTQGFGTITGAYPARQIQFGMKLAF